MASQSPYLFFSVIFFSKKRDDFEGCLKAVEGCLKGVAGCLKKYIEVSVRPPPVYDFFFKSLILQMMASLSNTNILCVVVAITDQYHYKRRAT